MRRSAGLFCGRRLDVELRVGRETGSALTAVLAGNAHYGVGGPALLPHG